MAQIVFVRGEFQKFRTLSNIHMGSYEKDLVAESEIEFDGMVLKWGDEKFNLPTFIGAINAGWVVPIADNVSRYKPKPAGVKVRPATSDGPERGAEMEIGADPAEDEVFVGTVDGNNARREATNNPTPLTANTPQTTDASMAKAAALAEARRKQADVAEATVIAEEAGEVPSVQHSDDDNPAPVVVQTKVFDDTPKVTHNGMEIISDDQGGVPVATIGGRSSAAVGAPGETAGKARTVLSDSSTAATAVRMAEATRSSKTIAKVAAAPVAAVAQADPVALPSSAMPVAQKQTTVKWKRGNLKPTERAVAAVKKYGSDDNLIKQVMSQETDQVRRLIRSEIKKQKV